MKGKFIVIYGPNNLGKSEQVRRLVDSIVESGRGAVGIKYPIYDLPTGQRINRELRVQRTMSDLELQKEFAANRRCYEPELIATLSSGISVIAEDYTYTGVVWGMANNISREELLQMNEDLLEPDLAILLDGARFSSGIERGHRFEDSGQWDRARELHLQFAQELGWHTVDANQCMEAVHGDIARLAKDLLFS